MDQKQIGLNLYFVDILVWFHMYAFSICWTSLSLKHKSNSVQIKKWYFPMRFKAIMIASNKKNYLLKPFSNTNFNF